MTREEEIMESAAAERERNAFLLGANWAVDHPMHIYTDNEQVIANLQEEVERLKNPWRDAKKELPKENTSVFINFNGEAFSYSGFVDPNGRWYCYGSGYVRTPEYWMPIPPLPEGGEK